MYCARGRAKYTLKRIVKLCSSRFGAESPCQEFYPPGSSPNQARSWHPPSQFSLKEFHNNNPAFRQNRQNAYKIDANEKAVGYAHFVILELRFGPWLRIGTMGVNVK